MRQQWRQGNQSGHSCVQCFSPGRCQTLTFQAMILMVLDITVRYVQRHFCSVCYWMLWIWWNYSYRSGCSEMSNGSQPWKSPPSHHQYLPNSEHGLALHHFAVPWSAKWKLLCLSCDKVEWAIVWGKASLTACPVYSDEVNLFMRDESILPQQFVALLTCKYVKFVSVQLRTDIRNDNPLSACIR